MTAALRQHEAYCESLDRAGANVIRLPATEELPDSVFVEDTALIVDDLAIMARLGARSRVSESARMAAKLAEYRTVRALSPAATLDGGDVVRIGRRVFVGQSSRTNGAALDELAGILGPRGYSVLPIIVPVCLHLKTGCTSLGLDEAGRETVLVNARWIDPTIFSSLGYRVMETDPDELFAANTLRIGQTVIVAGRAPRTNQRLADAGFMVDSVDISEFQKAEGGLTCLSLLLAPREVTAVRFARSGSSF
jgi:dimethylargininase